MEKKVTSYRAVTHHRPDLDELFALWLLSRFGKQVYPGLSRSPIQTIDAGLSLTPGETGDKWLDRGCVVIGALGGQFDEHGKGDGKSAASLTAEFLGLTENGGLKPILEYAVKADDKATDGPFAMARLIKDMHSAGVPLEQVRRIVDRWLNSLYDVFMERYEKSDSLISVKQIAIGWFLERFHMEAIDSDPSYSFQDFMDVPEVRAQLTEAMTGELAHIQKYLDVQMDEEDPFSFAGVVYAMQMDSFPPSMVIEDARVVLNAKVFVQQQFMAAIDDFASKSHMLADCPVKVAVIHSDNEQMNRAARASDPQLALIVQVRSSGHVQIFSDHRRDLRPILARLRDAENVERGGRHLPPWRLYEPGTLPEVPEWFGFEKYGKVIAVFNSTVKTRRVPRTILTLAHVEICVREGLAQTTRPRGHQRAQR